MHHVECMTTEARRPPCAEDGPDYAEFCAGFGYEPTPDQAKCMEDVTDDMVNKQQPMDRLLCGDVGFGKGCMIDTVTTVTHVTDDLVN